MSSYIAAMQLTNNMVRPFMEHLPINPPEGEVVALCEDCGSELYEGEEVYQYDDMVFCDWHCLKSHLIDTLDIQYKTLGERE